MRKRILCLIDSLNSGGAQRQLLGLADMLSRKGFIVTLAFYHSNGFYEKQAKVMNFETIQIPVKGNKVSKLFHVGKFVWNGHYDVVIAYLVSPSTISCILRLMGMNSLVIVSERNTTQKLSARERLKFFAYRWADYVVPNSQSQGKYISLHYPSLRKKTSVITNYTDIGHFFPDTQQYERDEHLRLLVIGRISRQKNIPNFLYALSMVLNRGINVSVDWFGYAKDNDYYDYCKEIVHGLGVEKAFTFHDPTDNVLLEYRKCDVFCLPSLYEGFPNVICEAMACGKPILCSRICDNPYIVKEGVNGLMFDPKSPEDIAAAIQKIVEMGVDGRIQMGKQSRAIAEETFNEDNFIEKYITLIGHKHETTILDSP